MRSGSVRQAEAEFSAEIAEIAEEACASRGTESVYVMDTQFGIFMFGSEKEAAEAGVRGLLAFTKFAVYRSVGLDAVNGFIKDNIIRYDRTGTFCPEPDSVA